MDKLLDLRTRLIEKEKNVESEKDQEKIKYLKVLLNNEGVFFDINLDTAFGIMDFLGVPEDLQQAYYNELTSPEMYLKTKREYVTIEKSI